MTLNNWMIWKKEWEKEKEKRKEKIGWKRFSANEMTSFLERV